MATHWDQTAKTQAQVDWSQVSTACASHLLFFLEATRSAIATKEVMLA